MVDYLPATATVSIDVSKATPVITWTAPAPLGAGQALSATQLDASTGVAGTFVYSPALGTVLDVGNNQTLGVTFTPADTTDYTSASGTVTINVAQATPAITWANPANIILGTALGATQLDATASVPGQFAYSPPAGTVLSAGSQTLSVTFTPTDTTDYTSLFGHRHDLRGAHDTDNVDDHVGQPGEHHVRYGPRGLAARCDGQRARSVHL